MTGSWLGLHQGLPYPDIGWFTLGPTGSPLLHTLALISPTHLTCWGIRLKIPSLLFESLSPTQKYVMKSSATSALCLTAPLGIRGPNPNFKPLQLRIRETATVFCNSSNCFVPHQSSCMSLSCATPLGRILELQRMQRLVASRAGQPLTAQVRMRADMDTVALATVEAARGRGILSTLMLLLRGAKDSELRTIPVLLGSRERAGRRRLVLATAAGLGSSPTDRSRLSAAVSAVQRSVELCAKRRPRVSRPGTLPVGGVVLLWVTCPRLG